MSEKVVLQSIILKRKSTFTIDEIVTEAKEKILNYSSKTLDNEIKSIMSTYIKNGMICITQHGYQRCSF